MRVPDGSVLAAMYGTRAEAESVAIEDGEMWGGGEGPLPPLPLTVRALSRAELVYGFLTPA